MPSELMIRAYLGPIHLSLPDVFTFVKSSRRPQEKYSEMLIFVISKEWVIVRALTNCSILD